MAEVEEEDPNADPKDKLFMAHFWGNPWYSVPIGFLAFGSAIAKDLYVLDPETQLSCLFFLFIGTAYSQGGDAFAKMIGGFGCGELGVTREGVRKEGPRRHHAHPPPPSPPSAPCPTPPHPTDDSAAQIKSEHQAAEVAKIEMLEDLHAAHQETAGLAEDIASIYSEIDGLIGDTCASAATVAAVNMRNETVKKLDALSRAEDSMAVEVQTNLIENATAAVRAAAPGMSDAAMAAALAQLADPSARPADPVQNAFSAYIKDWSSKVDASRDTEVEVSAEAMELAKAEAEAVAVRDGLESIVAGMTLPTKVKIGNF